MNEKELLRIVTEANSKTHRAAYFATAIKDSVAVICFTALAVIFRHWWIALFSIFLISDITTNWKGAGR